MGTDLETGSYAQQRKAMVDGQVRPADVTRHAVIDAMMWAPRETFVPKARRAAAYIGEAIALGDGRFEIDPRIFAKMADAAQPRTSDLVLVVGAGLGYAAAVLSRMTAAVVALEENEEFAAAAKTALADADVDNVAVEVGPLTEGCATHAPYDLIFINGAAEHIPQAITDQLAEDGRMVAIRMHGAVGRCEFSVRAKDVVGARPLFDASAAILPGFSSPTDFKF